MPTHNLKGRPHPYYRIPLFCGLFLVLLSILFWMYPRLLLFLIVAPLFITGLGMVLFALDLWKGVPNWRQRVHKAKIHVWPGDSHWPGN